MFAHLIRQRTHLRTAAPKAGTRLRRLGAALAAVTIGLLASAATIPAAFAREVSVPPPGAGYETARFGLVPATTSQAASTGIAGWQSTLIVLGAMLAAGAVLIVLARARAAHRAAPSPAA
jgi:hypothetical protein